MVDDKKTSDSVANQFTKEVRSRLVVVAATGVVAGITAAAISAWTIANTLIGDIGLTPRNAVATFAQEGCPPGWEPFRDGWGRVVVGAVSPDGLTQIPSGFAEDETGTDLGARPYGKAGGVQESVLTADNLPSHAHTMARGDPTKLTNNDYAVYTSASRLKSDTHPPTEPAGSTSPAKFSNMPPYVALTICRKT